MNLVFTKNWQKYFFISTLLLLLFGPLMGIVSAQRVPVQLQQFAASCSSLRKGSTIELLPAWDKNLQCDPGNDGAITQFSFPGDIWLIALAGVEILLRVAVYLAIGFVIYGGFYMTISQGSPEKIQAAKQTIEQALTGMVIALLATGVVLLVEGSIA